MLFVMHLEFSYDALSPDGKMDTALDRVFAQAIFTSIQIGVFEWLFVITLDQSLNVI